MREFSPGDVFVNHRIEGLAGRGGMGVVYRARDLDLDRIVALKVIAPALAEEPDFRARFVAESKAAASIEHPHVIPVYYAGEREGVLFIVMRYVDGPDLRALVRAEGRLDPERAAHVVAQVGGALDAAHAHGLVHRDVKPANVLLGAEDHAYLTDFGLTKRAASTGGLSRPGGWVGTLGFVAPEQIRGERVDARTDVYALGCVLVHALTGTAPYMRDSDEATLWAHLNAPPATDGVPGEFTAVVERALSKDPADRYPSAGDLGRAALAAAGRSTPPGPERNVARGAAAPEGMQTAATAPIRLPNPDEETHVSPGEDGDGAANRGGRGSLAGLMDGPLALAGGGLALGLGVLAAILLLGGGGGGGDDRTPGTASTASTATQPPASRKARAEPPLFLASRPNGLTIADGFVWVLSNKSGEIVPVSARTNRPRDRIDVGKGGTGVAAGFNSVWAVKSNTGAVIRISSQTAERDLDRSTKISFPGQPFTVATGEGAIWVGVRKKGLRNGDGESVVRIDPSTLGQDAVSIPGGVQDLAVGAGGVWVTNSYRDEVVRIDPDDLAIVRTIPVGRKPNGIAVGFGAVWVAAPSDNAINRINPRSYQRRDIPVGDSPTRVAVGGGSVWVTARGADRLIRIDPRTRRVRERIKTGRGPFALDVTSGSSVWVTLLSENAVQRIRFYR